MSENKAPRWENEDIQFEKVDDKKVVCKDCFLRAKDAKIGEVTIPGCTKAFCEAYPKNSKPVGILLNGEDCPYYINENEEDEE